MDYESGFKTSDEDVVDVSQPTDRRPDFCAETLSPGTRIGLLAATCFMVGLLSAVLISSAVWPEGVLALSGLMAAESVGILLALGFLLFVVFGALAGNNPRLGKVERGFWYVAFGLVAPIAFPAYWFVHVQPVPYQPTFVQKL